MEEIIKNPKIWKLALFRTQPYVKDQIKDMTVAFMTKPLSGLKWCPVSWIHWPRSSC